MTAVVLHSGGLDSTVLLEHLHQTSPRVLSLGVFYGQRHERELEYADRYCRSRDIERLTVDLSNLGRLLTGSSQTDRSVPVPEGHYEHESMKLTVVPNRNMVLLATAGAIAVARKFDSVAYAAHAGDHAIYPDCRPEFADAMDRALGLADWSPVRLARPFVGKTKADLVRIGADLGVSFAETWSCYAGGEIHCGRCGTCVERREAFEVAGVPDPTEYEPA